MNLKELSVLLGLSPTTVSRALGGYPEVKEETRRRVQEAAARFNYRPSARARSLATGRTMTIGCVIPLSERSELQDPVFGDFIAGAGETCQAAGYDILISMTRGAEEAAAFAELAAQRAVDGFLLRNARADDPRFDLLARVGLPFVADGRGPGAEGYSWVDHDEARAFRRAAAHLLQLGHRRIALVLGPAALCAAGRMREGYEAALCEAGVAADERLILAGVQTENDGVRAARALMAAAAPPTACLVSSIVPALGVRRALAEDGLAPGRDVSLVTWDEDLSFLQNRGPASTITALRASARAAGRRAAETLLSLIAEPGRAPIQHLGEAELVIGDTTGPPPG